MAQATTPLHWIADASNPDDRMLGEVWDTAVLQTGSGFEAAGSLAREFGVPVDNVLFDDFDDAPVTLVEAATTHRF